MSRRWILWACAGLCGVTATASSLALIALRSGGEARVGSVALLRLAAGYDRKAEPILLPATPPPPALRREATQLSRDALALYPYDTSAWLSLAYLDVLDHGQLTPAGLAALRRSYDMVAVDPQVGLWRVRFALSFAQKLPKDVKADVKNEVTALAGEGRMKTALRRNVVQVGDPTGAVWLTLWLNQLDKPVAE